MAEVIRLSDAIRINATVSPEHLTAVSASTRLTDTQLAQAEAVAASPLPVLPACDGRHFDQCLRILTSSLPRKGADDLTGDLMLAAYRRKLGAMPAEQVNFLTDQALERCRWFPTIAECLQIAGEWERDDEHVRQRDRAIAAVRWEKQDRMEEIMTALDRGEATQAQVDAMPERWQSIAETRGLLRRLPEGGFVVRAVVAMEEGFGG